VDLGPTAAPQPILRSRRQRLLGLWAFACALLAVRAFADGVLRSKGTAGPIAVPVRIDLNRASLGELLAVPGLGPARAEAIVLHRVRHGWLRSVDELDGIDGIGPVLLQQVRPFVCVQREPASSIPQDSDPDGR
jgi:competence ComEA-like helix-hairpin-helix protein